MGKKLLGCWPGRGSGLECGSQAGEGGSENKGQEWRDVHCGGQGRSWPLLDGSQSLSAASSGNKAFGPHSRTSSYRLALCLSRHHTRGKIKQYVRVGTKSTRWCPRRSGVSHWSLPGTYILPVSRACQGLAVAFRGHQSHKFQVSAGNSIMEVAVLSPA